LEASHKQKRRDEESTMQQASKSASEKTLSMRNKPVEQVLLSPLEVGRAIGACRNTVYRMIHDGTLPHVVLGERGQIRVPRRAIDALIDSALGGKERSASSRSPS
jgi:excisionase family DNA binding protein